MTYLKQTDIELLKQLQDETQEDIKMLQIHFDRLEELLNQEKIEHIELGDDIETALHRKKNRAFALALDIAAIETEYDIDLNYNYSNKK